MYIVGRTGFRIDSKLTKLTNNSKGQENVESHNRACPEGTCYIGKRPDRSKDNYLY